MITYRVLQVDDSSVEAVPQIVTTGSTGYTNAGVPQVLTSNLNGQLYVIGNPNEMFASQAGTRTIAPRSSIIETTNSVVNNIKKVKLKKFVDLSCQCGILNFRGTKGEGQHITRLKGEGAIKLITG